MDLESLIKKVTNVSMNYDFFNFRVNEYHINQYKFKIEGIRSYNKNEASRLYKPLTRSIDLKDYENEQ